MSDDQITLKVKQTSNNSTFEVKIAKDASVIDLKKACTESTQLSEKEQNLVYKGRILADDKNLADYNVGNEHTIILVKKFVEKEEKPEIKKETTTTANTNTGTTTNANDPFSMFGGNLGGGFGNLGGGFGNMGGGMPNLGNMNIDPSQLNNVINNPQYMQMMGEMFNDPNTLNMIMNNPQLKPLLDSNPQLRQMMQNPQMMQMLLNPQNLQNALSMMGGGMGGLGNIGTGTTGTTGTSGTGFNPFSGLGGLNFDGLNTNTNTNVDPKEAYKEQNQKLKDMGFINEDLNFELLKETKGNVDLAVERLLSYLN